MTTQNPAIAQLNSLLKYQLSSINQYFLHARMLKHQGDVALADQEYKASIGAMKNADMLVEHILALGGQPVLDELAALSIGTAAPQMLANDLALAGKIVSLMQQTLRDCEKQGDAGTCAVLSRILESKREHLEFLRTSIPAVDSAA